MEVWPDFTTSSRSRTPGPMKAQEFSWSSSLTSFSINDFDLQASNSTHQSMDTNSLFSLSGPRSVSYDYSLPSNPSFIYSPILTAPASVKSIEPIFSTYFDPETTPNRNDFGHFSSPSYGSAVFVPSSEAFMRSQAYPFDLSRANSASTIPTSPFYDFSPPSQHGDFPVKPRSIDELRHQIRISLTPHRAADYDFFYLSILQDKPKIETYKRLMQRIVQEELHIWELHAELRQVVNDGCGEVDLLPAAAFPILGASDDGNFQVDGLPAPVQIKEEEGRPFDHPIWDLAMAFGVDEVEIFDEEEEETLAEEEVNEVELMTREWEKVDEEWERLKRDWLRDLDEDLFRTS
ncbi:hypothetical protein B0J11DRAFT_579786 [Dendryphion nanum]|uniref:Uncharacterized protein n=1 Tax=Dendryphion nanum TaxID=256645 RepID=A0A9P9IN47_9PLEO|nr:hypothetical protein B0J11DRAFT_579786 [Dendryphion nanum]